MRRRFLLQLVLAAVLPWAGASCLSPTIPLPPPETESIIEAEAGLWSISGTCEDGALVTVFNKTQGEGVVIEDRDRNGKFIVKLKANLCDEGWAYQVVGNEISLVQEFEIEPTSTDGSSSCH
jgi:hypothetical protein